MPTILPIDSHGNAIPALRPRPDSAHEIALTSSSARNSTAFATDTQIIGIYATTPARIALGDDSVTAADDGHYLPPGLYLYFAIGSDNRGRATHLAALADDSEGVLYISELD
jgi:hypothetical protein